MRKLFYFLLGFSLVAGCVPSSKTPIDSHPEIAGFSVEEVTRIETVLASDAMRGRRTFTPGIDMAADVIANEFKLAGLTTLNNAASFRQEFSLVRAKQLSVKGNFDGQVLGASEVTVLTAQPRITITSGDGYEKVFISGVENLQVMARSYARMNKDLLVYIDKKHASAFSNLNRLKTNFFNTGKNVVFVLSDVVPQTWQVEAEHEIVEQKLSNVVGILPGRSRPGEFVIFSAHYDHLGVGRPVEGDSIYNGANDDASGVTATIMLAKFFAKKGPQERTLVFAAFTAEEIGGYGSQYFSRIFDPSAIIAMFNIEMIGTESKWGKNSAFITGYERSDLGAIMQKNLQGSSFTFHPDPYPQQQLFYRSDNATLARLGVPAHTVSTAKMEDEPHYHRVTDEIGTLDMANMSKIIEAIAISAGSVIEGKDTPSRIQTENF